jgi:hypothetical protein
MNLSALKILLKSKGVAPGAYAIDGVETNEAYVLLNEDQKWLMFYSERGVRSYLRVLQDEATACAEFARVILSEFS